MLLFCSTHLIFNYLTQRLLSIFKVKKYLILKISEYIIPSGDCARRNIFNEPISSPLKKMRILVHLILQNIKNCKLALQISAYLSISDAPQSLIQILAKFFLRWAIDDPFVTKNLSQKKLFSQKKNFLTKKEPSLWPREYEFSPKLKSVFKEIFRLVVQRVFQIFAEYR